MGKVKAFALSLAALSLLAAISASSAFALGPPVNTAKPLILGVAEYGHKFSTGNGTWTESPTSYTYQWQRCNTAGAECTNISGAAEKNYTVVFADVGHTILSKVSAHNAAGEGSAASNPSKVITMVKFPEFVTPKRIYPDSFTYSTEAVSISAPGASMNCDKLSGSGSITSPFEIGSANLTLSGCRVQRSGGITFECERMATGTLHGHFGWISEAEKRAGLVLEPEGSVFATGFRCGGAQVTIQGSVIAEIAPMNSLRNTFPLKFNGNTPGNLQGFPEQGLEWNWPKGTFVPFGIYGTAEFRTSTQGELIG
jgi:hypothetical protein